VSRLLVVNADDMGLTPGVCRAIHRAHTNGVVTSTSVLAVGQAFDDAAALIADTDRLGVGAHLALVGEDRPLLSAREIPSLVDREGRFPLSYRTFVRRAVAGRVDRNDVAREFRAQLEKVSGIGVPVTHLDTHQHTHLWPAVTSVVVQQAKDFGIRSVRLPTSRRRGPLGAAVRVLSARARQRITAAGLVTTDDFAGLDEAGALDHPTFAGALRYLTEGGAGTAEINTHPAEAGDPDIGRFDWGYLGPTELAMLTDPATRDLITESGWQLGSFADLAAAA